MREHVDLPTLDALNDEWRQHPPVHHLVAAYLDYQPARQPGAPMSAEQERELIRLREEWKSLVLANKQEAR